MSCDYILGTDWRRFKQVGIRDIHNFSSDHFALRAQLLWLPTHFHNRYLRGRIPISLRLLPAKELSRVESKFQNLKTLEPVPPKMKTPPCPLCM